MSEKKKKKNVRENMKKKINSMIISPDIKIRFIYFEFIFNYILNLLIVTALV